MWGLCKKVGYCHIKGERKRYFPFAFYDETPYYYLKRTLHII